MKVLISPGFGAGWSTWNYIDLAVDPNIIRAFEMGLSEDSMCSYIQSLGYKKPYMSGYETCEIVEIPKGTAFKIMEYDGHEYIMTDEDFLTAL